MSENVHPKKFHILVHLCKIIEKKKQKGMGFCKKGHIKNNSTHNILFFTGTSNTFITDKYSILYSLAAVTIIIILPLLHIIFVLLTQSFLLLVEMGSLVCKAISVHTVFMKAKPLEQFMNKSCNVTTVHSHFKKFKTIYSSFSHISI